MRPPAHKATGWLVGSAARTLMFLVAAVVGVLGLGAAVTYGSLDEVVTLLALLPLGVAITLRSPRGTVLALAVWLAALGTTRRLFPTTSSSTLGDALLLVGPILLLLLFITSVEKGSLTNRTALAKPVYWLTALAAAEIVNPLQGSLTVGIGGGLFLVTPMLAFWVGRSLVDGQAIRRFLIIVAWLAIAAAGYGLAQTYDGFPSWDSRWIQTKGYAALDVGSTLRAFSSFASAQEYATFVAIGIAIWFARARTPASAILAVSAASSLGVALFLESSRSTLVYAVVAIGIMVAARSGVSRLGAVVGGGLALVLLLVIVDHAAGGGSTATAVNGNATGQLVGHQINGLAHPFDSQTSSLDGHFTRLLHGLGEAFTMPIGHGTGSVTNAASIFGTTSLGTELDPSNAAVAFGLPGLILYLTVLVRGLSTAFRVASGRRDWVSVAVLGILVVTVMQWLNGNLYSTVWLPWLCLGWTDRVDSETLMLTVVDTPRADLAELSEFSGSPDQLVPTTPLLLDDIAAYAERSVQSATRAAVLVTCLNDASGLETTLIALNQQSIRLELRVIVVINGSTDSSSQVAIAHADLVMSEPFAGTGYARIRGLSAVYEPYVLCLEAGARPISARWAESYVAALDSLPELIIGVTGPVVNEPTKDRWAQRPEMTPVVGRDPNGAPLYAYGGNSALRVNAVREIGGFDEEGADDVGLGLRARRAGLSFVWVDAAGVVCRSRRGIVGYWKQMREAGAVSAGLRPTPRYPGGVVCYHLARALWFGGVGLMQGDAHEACAGVVRCAGEAAGSASIWRRRRRVLSSIPTAVGDAGVDAAHRP